MNKRAFEEASRLVLQQNNERYTTRTSAVEKLEVFLDSQTRHTLTTFLRIAGRYVILLGTDPLLVGTNRTYILSGNGMGGLMRFDRDISTSEGGITGPHVRSPGLRPVTSTELVDEMIAHRKDPTNIIDRIYDEIDKIALNIMRDSIKS